MVEISMADQEVDCLSAAAPDLLAACNHAFDFLGGIDEAGDIRALLLAAITKATRAASPAQVDSDENGRDFSFLIQQAYWIVSQCRYDDRYMEAQRVIENHLRHRGETT